MKRWAWNIFCAFSLLVFVASVTLWVRSYYAIDYLSHFPNQALPAVRRGNDVVHSWFLRSNRGVIAFGQGYILIQTWSTCPAGWEYQTRQPEFGPFAFGLRDSRGISVSQQLFATYCEIPLWLFLPAGIPPFLWWRKWRKKRCRGFPLDPASPNHSTAARAEP